jgi:hypothetical protein
MGRAMIFERAGLRISFGFKNGKQTTDAKINCRREGHKRRCCRELCSNIRQPCVRSRQVQRDTLCAFRRIHPSIKDKENKGTRSFLTSRRVATWQACGLTQSALAQRIDKPQSYISKVEIGERRLDVIEFVEICQALGIAPSVILDPLMSTDTAAGE